MSVILVLTHVTDEQIQTLLALPRDQRLEHYQSTDFMTSHDQIDLDTLILRKIRGVANVPPRLSYG